ncbi:MAG: hypothetical protein H6700_02070 [Myxococcales bacterium]|nr:hypothetical protein [Myxococcales bacterium]MCB9521174.1 hypothetical protein [Myxococcales bacterium]MCB9530532.1 hypothetical protein [Myxococcales bacterium]
MRTSLVGLILGSALLVACGAEEGVGTCASSDDCSRGLSCLSTGCGESPCTSSAECLHTADFTETCLQENRSGQYDPSVTGVCTDEECRSDRDCDSGGICINSACYEGTAGPLSCTCRDDCPTGNACLNGTCAAPLGICDTDCNCAVGSVCTDGQCVTGSSPCDACTGNQACVDDQCVAACDPPCGAGQTCDPTTLTCEAVAVGAGLCSPCTQNSDCGDSDDICLDVGAGPICARACADADDCPSGYLCYDVPGASKQCVPAGGTCVGCLVEGCAEGQYCDPRNGACGALIDTCAACESDIQCGPGASCEAYGGGDKCLPSCADGGACPADFTCADGVCSPLGSACGGGCTLTVADCAAPLAVLDATRCICVGCLSDGDCPGSQTCNSGGTCTAGGISCTGTSDCDGGYCQGGVCVDCLTLGDCGPEEVCRAGACVPCDCPAGQRCTITGACEDVPDPSSCRSDSECVGIATDLGYTGENATCDSDFGCITAGVCNGGGGLGGLPIPDLGFGGSTDPFNAPCAAGTTCGVHIEFGASLFVFACTGCDPSDPSTCRAGETCTTPLFPLPDATPYCSTGGGGFFP